MAKADGCHCERFANQFSRAHVTKVAFPGVDFPICNIRASAPNLEVLSASPNVLLCSGSYSFKAENPLAPSLSLLLLT